MTLPPPTLRRIRALLACFIAGLVASGVTAIPLETELRLIAGWIPAGHLPGEPGLAGWLLRIQAALAATNARYPFLAYGTDWLAFGHIVIAVSFIGPWRDPVKNVWVIEFGMIACALVIPWATVFGGLRGIPFYWRLIDCSFGVFGVLPLWWCRTLVRDAVARPGGGSRSGG